jgi:alkylation response protein AidB-like acyl-CoA dehydrogenase
MAHANGPSDDRALLTGSPIYRAMVGADVPSELFDSTEPAVSAPAKSSMERCLAAARTHVAAGTVHDAAGIVAPKVMADLADAGYWGLRVGAEYGGSGASLAAWAPFVAEMATIDVSLAGLSSPHAALGPANLIGTFGNDEQKHRLLPPLARGERLGAFAITEPGTASDWGALRTTAIRDGDRFLLNGEKIFISNALPGRTVAVLCKIDDRLTMLIVELPSSEDERFRTVRYRVRAPAHVDNRGLIFHDLPVPVANALDADGRRVAYHGLNHGRVLVCAFAAGALRTMAATLIPWVQTRQTFGAAIGTRELVQRRLGRLAARIVACDAMIAWSSQLLDQGYRGELECVTTKVFGSEAMKEGAVDLLLKTHASRSFLPGNLFSDALHDLLAPTVFEGENEILTLGSFSSLAKARLRATASRSPSEAKHGGLAAADSEDLAVAAGDVLRESGDEVDEALRRHGPELAAHQAFAVEVAQRIQQATVMLVVSRYAMRQIDPLVRDAAVCMAAELQQRLFGNRPTAEYHQLLTAVGAAVAEERFAPVIDVTRGDVAMPEHLAR